MKYSNRVQEDKVCTQTTPRSSPFPLKTLVLVLVRPSKTHTDINLEY